MFARTFIVFAASVAAVAALPSASKAQLGKRDFVANQNGNIKIYFSDDTIKLGTAPVDVVFGKFSAACSDQGVCDTSPVDVTGYQLVDGGQGGEVDDETITITPSGSFPTWIHNGLLDALKAAVEKVAVCADVTNQPACAEGSGSCALQPFTVNECVVPRYWGIDYQDPSAANAAPPFVGADLKVSYAGDDGFCSTFATVASAVAGAVNGAAGSTFTLLGLFCQV